ncbi:MAG: hypothetical protein ACLQVI_03040 [Polyangiaceae bacterium]|jgi:hypothetical protein
MFGKVICGLTVMGWLLIACGPAASLNSNEGGSCTSNNDCGGDVQCQPIQGRTGDYCCPDPPQSSSHENCHPIGNSAF